ncbi:hypothetical protein BST95_06680 [Halioglobus japonicus]|uniref:Uncharacterized protein n=1 Tax=Halioglobus japonicus TaxID=930805 RepID=A0AAP8MB09_9GAMM|nr:hypothetical protein BST95_06680 [Halioglobus japonicus]PLW84503.1 hypothetical protein C0029_18925 [Halioglobus japonicus]
MLGVLLLIGLMWVFTNESRASYSDYKGTVCCLSDSYFVEDGQASPLRMMYVDLDNGQRVEVPIRYRQFFVHYEQHGRILVRRSAKKEGSHPRYMAVRYLDADNR